MRQRRGEIAHFSFARSFPHDYTWRLCPRLSSNQTCKLGFDQSSPPIIFCLQLQLSRLERELEVLCRLSRSDGDEGDEETGFAVYLPRSKMLKHNKTKLSSTSLLNIYIYIN